MIHNLPVMAHMERLSAALEKEKGQSWGLAQGLCPEVSGGLLIVMPREQAAAYCKDMERLEVWSLCFDDVSNLLTLPRHTNILGQI